MKPAVDPEVGEWVARAREDLRAIDVLLDVGLTDLACLHAQPCAEKALEAWLVALGLDVPFTHDLQALLASVRGSGSPAPGLDDAAELLTPFAVVARYPGFGRNDAATASVARDFAARVLLSVERAIDTS